MEDDGTSRKRLRTEHSVESGEHRGDQEPQQEAADDRGDEVEQGQHPTHKVVPESPTRKEMQEHELTHVPYRPWCVFCRRARGRNQCHYRKTKEQLEEDKHNPTSTFSIDYCYFTTSGEIIPHKDKVKEEAAKARKELSKPVMAAYDRKSQTGYLHQAESKGSEDHYIWNRLIMDMDEIGYRGEKLIIKSDQERPITAVVNLICEHRNGQTVPMESPQGDSASNSEVEGWIRRAKEQVRTLKLQLESNIGQDITVDHPVWPWLVEWSAQVVNRFRVGEDGRTGIQRIRGKRSHKEICGFGERVVYMPLKIGRKADLEARMEHGVWLGLRTRTDEDIIGTPFGITRARTVDRLPEGQRWDAAYLASMRGTPRQPTPGRNSYLIPARPGATVDEGEGSEEGGHDEEHDAERHADGNTPREGEAKGQGRHNREQHDRARSMMEINKHDQETKSATMKNPLPPNNQFLRHHMGRNRGGCMQMR